MSVVGARPQFIKAAPVFRAAARVAGLEHLLIHTGQHYDYAMSELFFRDLQLPPPAYHLEVGSGAHAHQTGTMMHRLEPILTAEVPDWVIVFGDTNSTLAAALTAAKLDLRIAHVEAGLRSFRKAMPEEINRLLSDHVSTALFCPTRAAIANLQREGFSRILRDGSLMQPGDLEVPHPLTADCPAVVNSGDVMYDAVLFARELAAERSHVLADRGLARGEYYLATIHRAENTDNARVLERLVALLSDLDKPVVFPIHPRTAERLRQLDLHCATSVRAIDPVGYFDMLALEQNASAILTDSGGVQKEAFFFKVPCVTFRAETEWVETVETGWNTLAGTDPDRVLEAIRNARPGDAIPSPYGVGRAADTIVSWLMKAPVERP